MRRLENHVTPIAIATAAATLGLPPVTGQSGAVDAWTSNAIGTVPEFDLEVWSDAAVNVTAAILYGARPHPFAFVDKVVTSVTNATDKLNLVAHGLLTGDGPVYFSASVTMPTGLSATTPYWVIKTAANDFQLAESRALALAGTAATFSSDGAGVLTLSDASDTERLAWSTHNGLLGLAGDGAFTLAADKGYSKRIPHSPNCVAYALVGTLNANTLWATVTPIQDR